MNKEELEDFTKEEVIDILVDLVNRIEKNGNDYLKKFDDGGREDIEIYAYGAALVTEVNYVKIKVALKNKERYNQIIDETYKNFKNSFPMKKSNPPKDYINSKGQLLTKDQFIDKCKTDNEFSEKWGLKIEEKNLTREERYDLMPALTGHHPRNIAMRKDINNFEGNIPGVSYHEEWLDSFRIPTKIITVTYNNETVGIYE